MHEFYNWNEEVRKALGMLRRVPYANSIVDAMIPFRLGWSPERTARAMAGVSIGDRALLQRLSILQERGELTDESFRQAQGQGSKAVQQGATDSAVGGAAG